jgi:PadR family transcriptional regulator, regulatory protein PadR
MGKKKTNPDFLNVVPELLILKLLAGRPMYGYQLVQALRASGDDFQFGEGCIYPILHRLEAERLLSSRREIVSGRSRVTYEVTEPGARRLADSASVWKRIVRAVESVLSEEVAHEPKLA